MRSLAKAAKKLVRGGLVWFGLIFLQLSKELIHRNSGPSRLMNPSGGELGEDTVNREGKLTPPVLKVVFPIGPLPLAVAEPWL